MRLQQFRKQDFFKQITNRSADICETSGSQLFRTTTGVKSEPDTLEESRSVMSWKLQEYFSL